MWITKNQLNENRFSKEITDEYFLKVKKYEPLLEIKEPNMVEHNGVLMLDGLYLKLLFKNIEDVYTSFIKTKNKIIDGDGGLTGVGLNLREYAKIFKKCKYEKFESSVMIPYTTDDLTVVISHFLEVFPKEIVDSFEEKVFLTCSKISKEEADNEHFPTLVIPESLKNIDSFDDYVLIFMLVVRDYKKN